MSISPAMIALRMTGVPPSWSRSVAAMPLALNISRMMLPSTPPSVSIFEETTIWALAVPAVTARASTAPRSLFLKDIIGFPFFPATRMPPRRLRWMVQAKVMSMARGSAFITAIDDNFALTANKRKKNLIRPGFLQSNLPRMPRQRWAYIVAETAIPSLRKKGLDRLSELEQRENDRHARQEAKMIAAEWQRPYEDRRTQSGETAAIPAGAKASLKRLCGFYGGSERELLARLISDLERDTLAMLPG